MANRLETRIRALEQLQSSEGATTAGVRECLIRAGLPAPEPVPDENAFDYARRLPADTKIRLLAAYGVGL